MRILQLSILAAITTSFGCLDAGLDDNTQINPFLTLVQQNLLESNAPTTGGGTTGGVGSGQAVTRFRQDVTVTFVNGAIEEELHFNFLAWVNPSSISTAAQQDELFDSGYVQLTEEVEVGAAFILPVGTFVWSRDDSGLAERFVIPPRAEALFPADGDPIFRAGEGGESGIADPIEQSVNFITPDVMLVFLNPPVSCESIAFSFSEQEDVTLFGTLARVDAYECAPFQPGLFLQTSGGQTGANQFFEGDEVRFSFAPAGIRAGRLVAVSYPSRGESVTLFEEGAQTP